MKLAHVVIVFGIVILISTLGSQRSGAEDGPYTKALSGKIYSARQLKAARRKDKKAKELNKQRIANSRKREDERRLKKKTSP